MLHAISWQQYLTAVLVISLIYYAFVLLRYYRVELLGLIGLKNETQSVLPQVSSDASLMGAARPEPGMSSVSPEELMFAEPEPEELSASDDFQAEALTLVKAFEQLNDKPEFLALLELLVYKYVPFRQEIDLDVVMNTIREKVSALPFTIEDAQWPRSWQAD